MSPLAGLKWSKAQEHHFAQATVGQRLAWLIAARQVTQTDLAARIEASQPLISNIVNDSTRKPSAPTLLALAEALECNPKWLLDGQGNPFAVAFVTDPRQTELLRLYQGLPDDKRRELMAAARDLSS